MHRLGLFFDKKYIVYQHFGYNNKMIKIVKTFNFGASLYFDHRYTSVKIIKNEVGCRDDTVPKTVDTRRHCEED